MVNLCTPGFVALLFAARYALAQSVIAHYMAQQLYDYQDEHITKDIQDAMALGIDAFVLNIAAMDYEVDKIQSIVLPAAERLNFKLLYSFDTFYNWQPSDIVSLVRASANSSAVYTWNGKPLVSSFSPSRDGYGPEFWDAVKSGLRDAGVEVLLAPALTGTSPDKLKSDYPNVDGFLNWWSWPADVAANVTAEQDLAYKAVVAERAGPYIMAVSPWQFKDINGESWVQQSDTLLKYRWEQAINEVKPDIVEIVTWNDYGESHYMIDVNPIVNLGTDAPNYVKGVDHTGWQLMHQYYIKWFKSCGSSALKRRSRAETRATVKKRCNGTATDAPTATATDAPVSVPTETLPAPQAPSDGSCSPPAIEDDALVYWYRPFSKSTQCSGGTPIRNIDFVSDMIFVWARLASPATVRIDAGSSNGEFQLDAGVQVVSVPFPNSEEETPFFQILRDGKAVKSAHGNGPIKRSGCTWYNANPYVGAVTGLEAAV